MQQLNSQLGQANILKLLHDRYQQYASQMAQMIPMINQLQLQGSSAQLLQLQSNYAQFENESQQIQQVLQNPQKQQMYIQQIQQSLLLQMNMQPQQQQQQPQQQPQQLPILQAAPAPVTTTTTTTPAAATMSTSQSSVPKVPSESRKKPKEKSSHWSPEEHQLFLEAIQKYGLKEYHSISAYVKTRTHHQVRTHVNTHLKNVKKKEGPTSGNTPTTNSNSTPQQSFQAETPMESTVMYMAARSDTELATDAQAHKRAQ
eukprot:gene2339-2653_t